MRKTAIIVAALVLAGGAPAEVRKNAPPRSAQNSAAPRPETKPMKELPRRDLSVKRCGGAASYHCILPVF
jgi:hypothetical protein